MARPNRGVGVRIYRYVTHAVVLLTAVAMSGYSAVDRGSPFSLGPRPAAANAVVADNAGAAGDVSVGRDGTIIKPVSIPTSALPNRKPILYTLKLEDSLESVAAAFHLPLRDVTWSNPGLRLPLKAGQVLRLPPVPGVVVVARSGDSPASLAASYGVDPTTIIGFNHVDGQQITPGATLVIPVDPAQGPNLSNGLPADPIAPGKLLCPVAGSHIIQGFGPTSFAVEPSYGGYLHFHTGVDLIAEFGTPIIAAAGGKVTAVGFSGAFGLRVEITDSYGLVEIYAHMQEVAVDVGKPVQQGEKIGAVGSTGLSIGSHLHLQLEIGGVPASPTPLVGCPG